VGTALGLRAQGLAESRVRVLIGDPFRPTAFLGSTRATTARVRPGRGAVKAAYRTSWSRPSTVWADQSAALERGAIPPGRPWVAEELSITSVCSRSSPAGPA
jgi:hypothetical protein